MQTHQCFMLIFKVLSILLRATQPNQFRWLPGPTAAGDEQPAAVPQIKAIMTVMPEGGIHIPYISIQVSYFSLFYIFAYVYISIYFYMFLYISRFLYIFPYMFILPVIYIYIYIYIHIYIYIMIYNIYCIVLQISPTKVV